MVTWFVSRYLFLSDHLVVFSVYLFMLSSLLISICICRLGLGLENIWAWHLGYVLVRLFCRLAFASEIEDLEVHGLSPGLLLRYQAHPNLMSRSMFIAIDS